MDVSLYYFSGTGNSLHVAKELQKRVPGAELFPIAGMLRGGQIQFRPGAAGLVFPLHAFCAPAVVREFLRKADVRPASYLFAIVTRGGSPGVAFGDIEHVLRKKGRALDANFYADMPNNFFPLHGLDTAEEAAAKEAALGALLETVSAVVAARQTRREKDPELNLLTEKALFPLVGRAFLPFAGEAVCALHADGGCTGCGLCETICPADKIALQDGRPQWRRDKRCLFCFACVSYCPARAIQIKRSHSAAQGRYHHPAVCAAQIAAQKTPPGKE